MGKELNEDLLVLLDLETTGLNPNHGWILEVGAVIADQRTLEVIDTRSWVVRPIRAFKQMKTHRGGPIEAILGAMQVASVDEAKSRADDYVRKMHTRNGLWDEVEASQQTLMDVGQEFPHWFHENNISTSDQVFTLAGNGPDRFDRVWLRHNWEPLNRIDDMFHYRSLDISNMRQAFKLAGNELESLQSKEDAVHRAVPDCLAALEDWKLIRSIIRSL